MTTIAYRDGIMASDSLSAYGNTQCDEVRKIRRVSRWLVGISGTATVCEEFCQWLSGQKSLTRVPRFERIQNKDDGAWCLVVDTKTKAVYRIDQYGMPYQVRGKYFACGSGMDFALAAMEMGADAKKAVKIAIKYDINSGGKVSTLKAK